MTINATAAILLLLYELVAEEQGVGRDRSAGTVQNDILKEYAARGTYIYPPKPSMRLITDLFAYCGEHIPQWNTISISGYHMREAGATAAQEIAFTLANGIAYVQAALDAGLAVDDFAPRLSFFFACHMNFFEEVAKFRAARRMWATDHDASASARRTRERACSGSTRRPAAPRSRRSSPRTTSCGRRSRRWRPCSAGTQSLHTNSFDEALALPTEQAVKIALRTQQVLGYETGVADTVDPLGGSYFVESLTDELEAARREYIEKIDGMGGAVAAIEAGYYQDEIHEAAFRIQRGIESGERVVVGVNRFVDAVEKPVQLQEISAEETARQLERLSELRASRDQGAVDDGARRRGRGRARHPQPPPADARGAGFARDPG